MQIICKATCFPLLPACRIKDIIFCTADIFEYRNFKRIAEHIPIAALQFSFGWRVYVLDCNICSKIGAFDDSSDSSLSQVKHFRVSIDWLRKIDFVLSEQALCESTCQFVSTCSVWYQNLSKLQKQVRFYYV